MTLYNEEFYNIQSSNSKKSAEKVVPEILSILNPKSVIDVGCGIGTWLSVFEKYEISDICGIDGEYVKKEMLQISSDKFIAHNLEEDIEINRKYDLAISLEVAEYLKGSSSSKFVENLAKLSDVIIFSAAIPFQGGVGHINEQWMDYWEVLFKREGYKLFDVIRPIIWDDLEVCFWYSQNMMLFIKEEKVDKELINKISSLPSFNGKLLVHPELYLSKTMNLTYLNFYQKLFVEKQYEVLINLASELDDEHSIFYLGRSYKEMADFEKAIKFLKKYLSLEYEQYKLSAMFHLGETYYNLNDKVNAHRYFENCLELTNQQHQKARDYLQLL